MQRRAAFAAAPLRPPPPAGRAAAVRPVAAKKGGKAGFAGEAQAQGLKVNARGKVSSRPGPPSRKQLQQQGGAPQQQPDAEEQQQPAAAAPTATTATSSSSSSAPAAAPARAQPAAAPQQQPAAAAAAAAAGSATPQAVIDRMAKRVAAFAIVPVLGGVVTLGAFWYLKVIAKVEYPMWVAYLGSSLMFGGGLLGITYGILSTSWDPRREGTALGWTELRANLGVIMERGKQGQR